MNRALGFLKRLWTPKERYCSALLYRKTCPICENEFLPHICFQQVCSMKCSSQLFDTLHAVLKKENHIS